MSEQGTAYSFLSPDESRWPEPHYSDAHYDIDHEFVQATIPDGAEIYESVDTMTRMRYKGECYDAHEALANGLLRITSETDTKSLTFRIMITPGEKAALAEAADGQPISQYIRSQVPELQG